MNEAKFTPGPWRLSGTEDGYTAIEAKCFTGEWKYICDRVRGGNSEQQKANLDLIAAAPDLYEALKGAMELLESIEDKSLVGDEGCLWPVEIARAALAKAEGKVSA